jgi:hypothetical protein
MPEVAGNTMSAVITGRELKRKPNNYCFKKAEELWNDIINRDEDTLELSNYEDGVCSDINILLASHIKVCCPALSRVWTCLRAASILHIRYEYGRWNLYISALQLMLK